MGAKRKKERVVREERLELSQVSPLEPKSSASTNSATLAYPALFLYLQNMRRS